MNDIINAKKFYLNSIKLDEKSYKKTLIYYLGYVATKDSKIQKWIALILDSLFSAKWMITLKKLIKIIIKC